MRRECRQLSWLLAEARQQTRGSEAACGRGHAPVHSPCKRAKTVFILAGSVLQRQGFSPQPLFAPVSPLLSSCLHLLSTPWALRKGRGCLHNCIPKEHLCALPNKPRARRVRANERVLCQVSEGKGPLQGLSDPLLHPPYGEQTAGIPATARLCN